MCRSHEDSFNHISYFKMVLPNSILILKIKKLINMQRIIHTIKENLNMQFTVDSISIARPTAK